MLVALVAALVLMVAASAETWILPADTSWTPDPTTFDRMAKDVEAAFHRAASQEQRDIPEWETYTIQYHGRESDGVRLVVVTGMCEAWVQMTSQHFDLAKESVGIADGGVCIFSASYDADKQTLQSFFFHGEA